MKIVLYVNSFLPELGGREVVVHYLAREYRRLGHDVRVLGPAGWWKHRKLCFGYPVHRWPTLRGHFPEQVYSAQLGLDTLIWGADIIHAHSTYPNGYTVACMNKNKPLVITPHGEDIHVIPEIGFGLRLKPELDVKIKKSLESAQLVTAISNSIVDSLKVAGVDENKIRLIPNGIDIERFRGQAGGIRKWLNISGSAPVIMTVGRYHPRKGLEILLRSMPHVLKDVPDAKLVIVGDSNGKLEPLVRELSLRESVRITGEIGFPAVSRGMENDNNAVDKLAGVYRASNVYVSAAMEEGAEGLSLAMLDGMAAGLPIVATAISGNKDLIESGINGLLVPPADPVALARGIAEILRNRPLAVQCGQNNLQTAKPYSWTAVAHQYLRVYQEAIRQADR
ncbi:MAG: glycosyltransferase family 4 protein [Desulfobacteraceae bacterium]|nr:glycosyltransferase family 4 protein [Desulfobacteraceae bacterium]